jgi:hypothetical protein
VFHVTVLLEPSVLMVNPGGLVYNRLRRFLYVPSTHEAAPDEFGPGLRLGLRFVQRLVRGVTTGRMKQLVDQNACSIFGSVDKDAGGITGIGVASVNV